MRNRYVLHAQERVHQDDDYAFTGGCQLGGDSLTAVSDAAAYDGDSGRILKEAPDQLGIASADHHSVRAGFFENSVISTHKIRSVILMA
jgi:hypothetical protein